MLDFVTVLAAASESGGGSFLVKPGIGLMIWTLLAFGATLYILNKLAFPKISEQLDKRQRAIEESIDTAERTKTEAEEILAEYRQRLAEARTQAEEIVARARKAAEVHERALFEAADDADKLDDVREQLGEISDAVSESRDLQLFFFSPYFSTE